ncbi:hypothetical protein ACFQ1M_04430 [Sungkyunkwania multivorans]|uniref:Anti-sigma factor n=1 Tax=Sungkyunkwania multivorans TaxID=1173618 RepID=A0ABW3CUJ3_9FLAO
MAQDIRKLFKEAQHLEKSKLSKEHEKRFLAKLEEELPAETKRSFRPWISMAASIVVLLAAGFGISKFYEKEPSVDAQKVVEVDKNASNPYEITLGNISPNLKKVEDYYVANINYELSQIEVDEASKHLFDSYMKKLTELNDEYVRLNKELNEVGPNQDSIDAMIDNLQLRLQLLYQLQEKLKELKKSKNEQYNPKIS